MQARQGQRSRTGEPARANEALYSFVREPNQEAARKAAMPALYSWNSIGGISKAAEEEAQKNESGQVAATLRT